MKNYLKSIVAKPNQLKLIFDNGECSKFIGYIEALNTIYGYQLINKKIIPVEPEDLVCPEKDLNTIIYKLNEYFHTVLDVDIDYSFKSPQTQNGKFCFGFDCFGDSYINILTRK